MKRARRPIGSAVCRVAGILLLLTLLSAPFAGGLYARYTHSSAASDSARVAKGLPKIELLENEATLESGIYKLAENTEVAGNTYARVIPGVDIAKNPFVRLTGESEVSCALYIKAEAKDVPDTVTYEVDGRYWEAVAGQDGVYKYTGTIVSGEKIPILKGNQLTVSDRYVGGKAFSLNFSAWIEQID